MVAGAFAGLFAIVIVCNWVFNAIDPKRQVRAQIGREIERYKQGTITYFELVRRCPEDSLEFGVVESVATSDELRPTVQIHKNF